MTPAEIYAKQQSNIISLPFVEGFWRLVSVLVDCFSPYAKVANKDLWWGPSEAKRSISYSKGGIHKFISLAEISELAAPHNSCKVCNERDHAVLQATDLW